MCDKPEPQGQREGYLEVADMWAQMDGYKCVFWSNLSLPYYIVPNKLNLAWRNTAIVIISKDMHRSLNHLMSSLQLAEDIGIFMEGKHRWQFLDQYFVVGFIDSQIQHPLLPLFPCTIYSLKRSNLERALDDVCESS